MARLGFIIVCLLSIISVRGQDLQRCASVERLQQKFKADRHLQLRFEQERSEFNKSIESGYFINRGNAARLEGNVYVIPVVAHIVLPDPATVTDEAVAKQLEVLNQAFAGTAADTATIPQYFRGLRGKSILRFCLAQQTPEGLPANGIHRVTTNRSSFSSTTEFVKYSSSGGTDAWNTEKYMNIWITSLSGGILGYSSFPDDGVPQEQGVVIDYRALPGGPYEQYDNGKTLVHEAGHFFNLYHIWGDDNGSCSGTDYVDDTPPQANSTTSCRTDKLFDRCTASGNGIMYQNYMDYTEDECLVIFTQEQVLRMEAAATTYLFSLISSEACVPVNLPRADLSILAINEPAQRLCASSFTPVVTIQNLGTDTLRSAMVRVEVKGGDSVSVMWQGNLSYQAKSTIELPSLNVFEGVWKIAATITPSDGVMDENQANDTLSRVFQYFIAKQELFEGFEDDQFPPKGWDIADSVISPRWIRSTGQAASGNATAIFESATGESITSMLRPIEVNLQQIDSAWLSFAYAGARANFEVLVSSDCGAHYTSIYSSPQLSSGSQNLSEESLEWIRDSVNISPYIDKGNLLFAFSSLMGGVGKMYLDDINIRKVIVNPNLKSAGFMVSPNPVSATLFIQFYPQPSTLKRLVLYSMAGQTVKDVSIVSQSSFFTMDVSSLSSGMYIVAAIFNDRKLYKKIIKR